MVSSLGFSIAERERGSQLIYPAQDISRSEASQENQYLRLNVKSLTFLAKTYGLVVTNRFQYIIYWQC